jgi:hypothetical protein
MSATPGVVTTDGTYVTNGTYESRPNAKHQTPNAKRRASKSLTGRRGVENSHRPVPLASGWRRFLGGCYSYLSPVFDKLSIRTGLVISVMFGLSGFPVSSYPMLEKPLKQP